LSRQTMTRIIHVIKQAKLQRLHRIPRVFESLPTLRTTTHGWLHPPSGIPLCAQSDYRIGRFGAEWLQR
jgi:hypothetical protein